MRKAVTIFLLVLLVSIQTPAGQLFKIPLLVEHLLKHQKQNHASFIDFLKDHYTASHNDLDWPEDQQLPFKTITYFNIGFAIVPGIIKANVFTPLPLNQDELLYVTARPQQHLASIFHPPRL